MVLTIRPSWSTHGDDRRGDRLSERLAVRRGALPLLAERGYDNTTVADITTAAGVSRRTFFRLFGGKSEVLSCDHEVYHLEMHTHLLQHQSERTLGRAARGAALIVVSLTADPNEAAIRTKLLAESSDLRTEENRWFNRHQAALALFLSDRHDGTTSIEAEMTAAAIIAAAQTSIRDSLLDPAQTALRRFDRAIDHLGKGGGDAGNLVAVIQSTLTIDELIRRIGGE
ncbi:TetR family transcriptional regulator [Arthrobacter sp. ISL-95]|uniref:TetR family transcriptional regulator n=1 Tax=Arthrobacter sp. ISL-95 TaxID=2819116 RepID=UPI001BE74EFA|nr:TetR family transcriptional regulator [Arthrobacter sp. ISL-95]MBT2587818.1 TetR family transcriptional regulator [Arthrobacter sp. ISL-95]